MASDKEYICIFITAFISAKKERRDVLLVKPQWFMRLAKMLIRHSARKTLTLKAENVVVNLKNLKERGATAASSGPENSNRKGTCCTARSYQQG